MYKVLIADDELLVRVGLKTSIDWEGNGFNVIGEARNGKEAIEIFNRENPDIVITDVCMPNMTGLELIQLLKKKREKLKSIILTHYDNFNYAQEAVNLGVSGYLLKSNLTQDNLLKYLKKAAKEIGPSAFETPSSMTPPEMEQLLQSVLSDKRSFEEIREKYFPYKNFVIATMLFHSQDSDPDFPAVGISNFDKVVDNISRQIFNEHSMKVYPLIKKEMAVYIFNMPDKLWESGIFRQLEKIMLLLKNNIKKYLNLNISIGISSGIKNPETIYHEYQNSLEACKYSFFEQNNIAVYSPGRDSELNRPEELNIKCLNKNIEQNNISGAVDFINHHFALQKQYKDHNYLHQSLRLLLQNLDEHSNPGDSQDSTLPDQFKLNEDIIDRFYNISALQQYITDLYKGLIPLSDSAQSSDIRNSHIIRKSKDYIQEHSSENISLLTVAQHVEVSRSYLSFLFKQELGINFTTYMTEIRIEKAKELLLNSNMKIYEIAEHVGFDSPYYFSKVFKEKTGMTCKDFRNIYYKHPE